MKLLSEKTMGYIYLITTFIMWGSLFVAAKFVMAEVPPLMVLATRYGISVIVLYFIMKRRGFKKIKKEDRKFLFAIGGVGYFLGIAFQLMGNDLLDASLSSLINSLNPVVIPIIATMFLKEKINWQIILSIILSVIGVYIILGVGGNASALGITVNVLSLLFWSVSCCMVRKISAHYDPIQLTLYAMAIALIFAIPAGVINVILVPATISIKGILALLYIALICTALSHVCWNRSLKILSATTCSLFYPIQPLTSAILAIVILGEIITKSFVIGAVIISVGIILAVIGNKEN